MPLIVSVNVCDPGGCASTFATENASAGGVSWSVDALLPEVTTIGCSTSA